VLKGNNEACTTTLKQATKEEPRLAESEIRRNALTKKKQKEFIILKEEMRYRWRKIKSAAFPYDLNKWHEYMTASIMVLSII
jgi:hypothetical protein